MLRPKFQGSSHLGQVTEATINAGHAAKGAGCVIENTLDNVRRDPEAGYAACNRPPQIVNAPVAGLTYSVQLTFPLRESRDVLAGHSLHNAPSVQSARSRVP